MSWDERFVIRESKTGALHCGRCIEKDSYYHVDEDKRGTNVVESYSKTDILGANLSIFRSKEGGVIKAHYCPSCDDFVGLVLMVREVGISYDNYYEDGYERLCIGCDKMINCDCVPCNLCWH